MTRDVWILTVPWKSTTEAVDLLSWLYVDTPVTGSLTCNRPGSATCAPARS